MSLRAFGWHNRCIPYLRCHILFSFSPTFSLLMWQENWGEEYGRHRREGSSGNRSQASRIQVVPETGGKTTALSVPPSSFMKIVIGPSLYSMSLEIMRFKWIHLPAQAYATEIWQQTYSNDIQSLPRVINIQKRNWKISTSKFKPSPIKEIGQLSHRILSTTWIVRELWMKLIYCSPTKECNKI